MGKRHSKRNQRKDQKTRGASLLTTNPCHFKRAKGRCKRKRRGLEVSPCARSRYGCGRLHWNMRNHGIIQKKSKRRKVAYQVEGDSSCRQLPDTTKTSSEEVHLLNEAVNTELELAKGSDEDIRLTNDFVVVHPNLEKGLADKEVHFMNDIVIIYPSSGSATARSTDDIINDSVFDNFPCRETNQHDAQHGAQLEVEQNAENRNEAEAANQVESEDSLKDVANVPLHEGPVVEEKQRPPSRKCAIVARIKIGQIYSSNRRRSKKIL